MKKQSTQSQLGEIEFRKKLIEQQVEGKQIFDDEFDAPDIERIMADRMRTTVERMSRLQERKVTISPYIELGAERCQRALAMENELGAVGAAVDISYDMLKSGAYYRTRFQREHMPLRICCDANTLPMLSGSLPFVFCYQTLHHFPELAPIIQEIYRVLAPGGSFLFSEEPYKKALHVHLYRRRAVYTHRFRLLNIIQKFLDYFMADMVCNEVEYGINENHAIPLREWRQVLDVFDEHEVTLRTLVLPVQSELYDPSSHLKYLLAYLLGGGVSGVCRKSAASSPVSKPEILQALACPSCLRKGVESPVHQNGDMFLCDRCALPYPVLDGVIFLFTYEKFQALYPDIFKSTISPDRRNIQQDESQ